MTRIAFFGKDTTDHLCHRICPDRLCFPAKFAKEYPDPGVTYPSGLITSYRPRTGAPAGQQRRLKGRILLEPEIDLGRYKVKAVIDHLSVVMTCQGHANRAAISKHLSRATGCPVSVKAYGNALTARVQDVTPDRLRRLVGAIQQAETLHTDGRLAEIEVSVDFHARDHRDETRWELTDILWRHLRPEGSVWRQEEGEARCCYGDGRQTYKIFKVRQSEGQRTMHAALTMLITVPVNDNQFSACLLLAYNVGLGAFADSTALRCLNAGDPEAMAWWNKARVNGKLTVLPGLARRRAEEIALFRAPDQAEPTTGDGTSGFDTRDTAQKDQDMGTTDFPPLAFWKTRSFWLALLSLGSAAGAVFGMPEIGQLAGAALDAVEGGVTPEEAAALVSAAGLVFARLERVAPARRLAWRD